MNEEYFSITSSEVWYSERKTYAPTEIGHPRKENQEIHGFEVLNGCGVISGTLYGGCIESIYEAIVGNRHPNEPEIIKKYNILLKDEEWQDKILFLETCEEKSAPEKLEEMLLTLENEGIFKRIKGLIIGKPSDEIYYEEYKDIYKKLFKDTDIPILYNINFGHAVPRCIIPYGAQATIDYDKKTITIDEPIFKRLKR